MTLGLSEVDESEVRLRTQVLQCAHHFASQQMRQQGLYGSTRDRIHGCNFYRTCDKFCFYKLSLMVTVGEFGMMVTVSNLCVNDEMIQFNSVSAKFY